MLSSKPGVQNITHRNDDINLINYSLGVVSNYALKTDEPNVCQLANKSTPIDQPELISYQRDIVKSFPTNVTVANPPDHKQENVMYGVRLDTVIRTTSSIDDTYQADRPVVLNLSIKHALDSSITPTIINDCVSRLMSALFDDSGVSRVDALMRGSLKPTKD